MSLDTRHVVYTYSSGGRVIPELMSPSQNVDFCPFGEVVGADGDTVKFFLGISLKGK